MSLETIGLIGLISAASFIIQSLVRKHEWKKVQWRWVVDFFSVSLIIGILGACIIALLYLPNLNSGLVIWGTFNPHIAFIIPWCIFALLVLRKRFGVMMIPSLALLYGLSEVFFNALALFAGWVFHVDVPFFTAITWQLFFIGIVFAVALSYLMVKPRFLMRSPVLFIFSAYCLLWLSTGLRSIDDSISGVALNLPFDLAWQANMFMFGTWVMKPR